MKNLARMGERYPGCLGRVRAQGTARRFELKPLLSSSMECPCVPTHQEGQGTLQNAEALFSVSRDFQKITLILEFVRYGNYICKKFVVENVHIVSYACAVGINAVTPVTQVT